MLTSWSVTLVDHADSNLPGKRRKPWKRFTYFPLIPRFKRLYNTRQTASLLRLHGRFNDDRATMSDLQHGAVWRETYGPKGVFADGPRHLSLGEALYLTGKTKNSLPWTVLDPSSIPSDLP